MSSTPAVLGITIAITVLTCAAAIGKAGTSWVAGHSLLQTLED